MTDRITEVLDRVQTRLDQDGFASEYPEMQALINVARAAQDYIIDIEHIEDSTLNYNLIKEALKELGEL